MCERVNTGPSKRVTSAHHRDNFYLFHSKGEDSLYNHLTAADRGQKEDKRIKNRIEESERKANGSVDSHLLFSARSVIPAFPHSSSQALWPQCLFVTST